ncbi:MAG TPA: peptidoglycan-associated lipoprotein Pal [Thermoanaerobaculia bacterium]|nr:peptidoglycan-associated lipoprotein Pal [Thermoanaerobaculia bacterium]
MKPSRSFLLFAVLAALALASGACGPKASPDIPADALTDTSAPAPRDTAEDVGDAARSRTDDPTPSPLDADIKDADDHARSTGLIGDVYFDFDRYNLKPEARERLSKNADFLKQNPGFLVTIEGHCDERGTNDYNIALGDRRANSAKEYLVTLGIPAARLRTVSYGEERPVCTESNESCWWRNRRAEFHLSGRS